MKRSSRSKPSSSGSSNGKSPKTEPRDLRKSIPASVLKRAKEIAEQYTVVLEPHPRRGFMGSSVEFPTVFTQGKTAEQCVKSTREALKVGVAVMLQAGQSPPVPAIENVRDQQINIRLTAQERLLLESAAKRRGFRGVSDYVRNAALSQIRKSA